MNCKTENLVYVMFCMGCQKSYIGETGQKLYSRASEHCCHIRNKEYRSLEVSHHIFECAGHLSIPFKIMPIFKMPLNCTRIERECKEFFFPEEVLSFFTSWPSFNRRLILSIDPFSHPIHFALFDLESRLLTFVPNHACI